MLKTLEWLQIHFERKRTNLWKSISKYGLTDFSQFCTIPRVTGKIRLTGQRHASLNRLSFTPCKQHRFPVETWSDAWGQQCVTYTTLGIGTGQVLRLKIMQMQIMAALHNAAMISDPPIKS